MAATWTLVTDGACSGNGTDESRGGGAAIITGPDGAETVLTGGEYPTTNNRMELMAALEGLRATPEGSDVELVTDSSYLANAIRSEEHTSELQSLRHLVCRLLLEKKKKNLFEANRGHERHDHNNQDPT